MAISDEMNATTRVRETRRRGAAFLFEAIVTLAFLMAALAIFVQLFSSAQLEGLRANQLSDAVIVASNRAEEFSADPTGTQGTTTEGSFEVTCTVTPTKQATGTYYDAVIEVFSKGEQVYELHTARYVSDAERGDAV